MGTMMRHAELGMHLTIGSLTMAVCPSACLCLLIATIGRPELLTPTFLTERWPVIRGNSK
jgi:hypothetical protein